MNLPHGLRAFRYRNYRLFIAGQGTSQMGNWLQQITTAWLMYRMSDSMLLLGVLTFALQIPFFFLAPVAGVFIDRLEVRMVLIVTNTIACIQTLVVLVLVATGAVRPWHLILANLVLGLAQACDAPARQSLTVQLVDRREDLANAIALNSSAMNGARFVGPMLGGFIISSFGEAWAFAVNSVMRMTVVAALLAMHLQPRQRKPATGSWAAQFAAGIRYAYGFLPSRCALLLLAASSFTIQSYAALLPWFARERFHGDSHTLGVLVGAAGCGALAGMIYLAARPSVRGLFRLIGLSAAGAGVALLAFSFAPVLWMALPMLFITGTGMMLTAASTNTVLQIIVSDELRGRVASLYIVSFLGLAPLGALFSGWAAEHFGAPHAIAISAVGTLIASGLYWTQMPAIRTAIKPVYDAMGLEGAKPR